MTKLSSKWTLVPFVGGKERYGYPTCTWNYGTFVLTAESLAGELNAITISDPQDFTNSFRFGVNNSASIYRLNEVECVNLLSGIKEVVVATLRDISEGLLKEADKVAKVANLANPK